MPRVRAGATTCPTLDDVENYHFTLDVYRLSTQPEPDEWTAITVSAGMGSLVYLRDGFTDQDVAPTQEPYRWTLGDARIVLPWPADYESVDLDLTLDWSDWRPEGTSPAEFAVYIEGKLAAELSAGETWGRRPMEISAHGIHDIDGPGIEIRLVSDLWKTEGSEQELGVSFYGMQAELVGGVVADSAARP